MNKKVLILRAKTPEQLSEEINRIKEDTIATQIFQDRVTSDWIAFCWYEPKIANEQKPNKDWKKEPADEWMKKKLKSWNINIPMGLTKGRYYELLKENEK